jgi:hypothetical protein
MVLLARPGAIHATRRLPPGKRVGWKHHSYHRSAAVCYLDGTPIRKVIVAVASQGLSLVQSGTLRRAEAEVPSTAR